MAVVQVAHARRRNGNAQSFAAVNLTDTFIIHIHLVIFAMTNAFIDSVNVYVDTRIDLLSGLQARYWHLWIDFT